MAASAPDKGASITENDAMSAVLRIYASRFPVAALVVPVIMVWFPVALAAILAVNTAFPPLLAG